MTDIHDPYLAAMFDARLMIMGDEGADEIIECAMNQPTLEDVIGRFEFDVLDNDTRAHGIVMMPNDIGWVDEGPAHGQTWMPYRPPMPWCRRTNDY